MLYNAMTLQLEGAKRKNTEQKQAQEQIWQAQRIQVKMTGPEESWVLTRQHLWNPAHNYGLKRNECHTFLCPLPWSVMEKDKERETSHNKKDNKRCDRRQRGKSNIKETENNWNCIKKLFVMHTLCSEIIFVVCWKIWPFLWCMGAVVSISSGVFPNNF